MTAAQQPSPLGPRPVTRQPESVEPLWRDVLGDRLRRLRLEQGLTLAETAARAGISTQYLSEVERGLKEPSSEIIAAVAGALGTTLAEVTGLVSLDLTTGAPTAVRVRLTALGRPTGPVALAA